MINLGNTIAKWKLSDPIGSSQLDSSFNSHNLIEVGTAAFSLTTDSFGKTGKALTFDGVDQYITHIDNVKFSVTGDLTIFGRFKFTTAGTKKNILSKWIVTGQQSYLVFIESTNKLVFLVSNDGTAFTAITGGTTLVIDTWYSFIAVHVNGSQLELYLNDVSDAAPVAHTTGIFDSTADFRLGSESTPPVFFYEGDLSNILLMDQILTPTERTQLFNSRTDFQTLYEQTIKNINKTPTTLISIDITEVTDLQTATTYLFSEKDKPLHIENPTTAKPYLISDFNLGQEIKETVTVVNRLSVILADDFNADDSTFWRVWKANNPFYLNRRLSVKKGFSGFNENEYKTIFTGLIQNMIFKNNGTIEFVVKNLLTIGDQLVPNDTDGKLSASLPPSGNVSLENTTDMDQYEPSGYVKINNELINYSSKSGTTLIVSAAGRGKFNPDGWDNATTHDLGEVVHQVTVFEDLNPIDIVETLLETAGLDITPGVGDLDNGTFGSFNTVRDDWFNGIKVRGVLDKSLKITQYLKELRESGLFSIFQNESQQLAISYLAPPSLSVEPVTITDANNIVFNSSVINDKMDLQLTRVTLSYNLLGSKSGQDPFDYTHKTKFIDVTRENNYLQQKSKEINSRWIRTDLGGDAYALRIIKNYIRIFGDGRKTLSFSLETKYALLQVGDLFFLTTSQIQNSTGTPISDQLFYVFKKQQSSNNLWQYEAYDSTLTLPIGYISPSDHPDFTSASVAQKKYAFIGVPEPTDTGDISSGSAIVQNLTDTSIFFISQLVTGIGVPFNTKILSIDSGTQITLTDNATTTTIGITLTFYAKLTTMSDNSDGFYLF